MNGSNSAAEGAGWRPPTIGPAAAEVTKSEAEAIGLGIIEQVQAGTAEFYAAGDWEPPRTVGPMTLAGACIFQISSKAPVAVESADLDAMQPVIDDALAAHDLPAAERVDIQGTAALSAANEQVRVMLRGAVLSVEVAAHPDQCG